MIEKPGRFIRFRIQKGTHRESGQSVILISMVVLSFLLFFQFAINTGLLVTAKISVQAAADAAAYAGAATQARQLNSISYLNYDMRRQFKKFAYRNNFVGNVGGYNFPNEGNSGDGLYSYPKRYYTGSGQKSKSIPLMPIICLPLTDPSKPSEYCLQLNLPNSVYDSEKLFPGGGLTAITRAFVQAVKDISAIQQGQCGKQGGLNIYALSMWLFRGDADDAKVQAFVDQIGKNLSGKDKQTVYLFVQNLTRGLGLYPRNILNSMRIKTLESFINTAPDLEITSEKVDSWEKSQDAEARERSIQAFRSALSNLNNEVMDHESVIMQELQGANQLKLELVKTSFTSFFQAMMDPAPTNTDPTMCKSQIMKFPAPSVPVGFKSTAISPYYSVKVKAKAKLMFSPIKDGIELEAVATAKPFGSRIGPKDLNGSSFTTTIEEKRSPNGNVPINDCIKNPNECKIADAQIYSSGGPTFSSQSFLKSLAKQFIKNQQFLLDDGGGLFESMSPQPIEVGHYNILPSPKNTGATGNELIDYSKEAGEKSKVYRFYAPIFAQSKGNDSKTQILKAFDEVFDKTQVSQVGGIDFQAIKDDVLKNMEQYVKKLAKGGAETEHGETETFAAIELPMAMGKWKKNTTVINDSPEKYWLNNDSQILTSWAPASASYPRFGFSVKHVATRKINSEGGQINDDDAENIWH
jgi:hypothetical protein